MTQTFGVVGHPVAHSLSPAMFEAAFFEYNLDARYERFDVRPEDLEKFLEEMRGGAAGRGGSEAYDGVAGEGGGTAGRGHNTGRSQSVSPDQDGGPGRPGTSDLGSSPQGLSVTIPHKEAILGLLDEVDDKAKIIGAVNTVVSRGGTQGGSAERQKGSSAENMRKRSKLKGYNTDWLGALRALEDVTALEGKRVLVLGAGGAAAAITYACLQAGARVTILNRNVEKARELAARFKGNGQKSVRTHTQVQQINTDVNSPDLGLPHPAKRGVFDGQTQVQQIDRDVNSIHSGLPGQTFEASAEIRTSTEIDIRPQINAGATDEILLHPADILIHTTSVGMSPNIHESLVPKEYFKRGMVIMDIVYNPLETRLVKEAKAAGCRIVPGYKMLLYQAEKQFELWFKKKPPLEKMEKALLEAL